MNTISLPCSAETPLGLFLHKSSKRPPGIKANDNAIAYCRVQDEFGSLRVSFEVRRYASGTCSIYFHSLDFLGRTLDKLGPYPALGDYSAADLATLADGDNLVLPEGVPEPRMPRQVRRAWLDAERPLRVPFQSKTFRSDPDPRSCRLAVSFDTPAKMLLVAEVGPFGTAGRVERIPIGCEDDLLSCGLRGRDLLRALGRSTFGVFAVEPVPAEQYVEPVVPIHAEQVVPPPVDAIVEAGEVVAATPEVERPDAFEGEVVEAAVAPDPIEVQPADPLRSIMAATLARTKPAARRRVEVRRGLKRVRAGVRLPRPAPAKAPIVSRIGVMSLADLGMMRPFEVAPPPAPIGIKPPVVAGLAGVPDPQMSGHRPATQPLAVALSRPPPG